MKGWLTEISSRSPTATEVFSESLKTMSVGELTKLAFDIDPTSFQTRAEELQEKLKYAEKNGRELAHTNAELEKIAFIPALLSGAGRAAGALGGAKGIIGGVAKDMAIGTIANKALGALKPAASMTAGGFKYAFAGGLLQSAAGYAVRNPGTAITAAGAMGGALMAPRDAQTGQKQYLRGAVMGGVGAAGINAVSNGALANRMRSSVMSRQNPVLGQNTRQYLMDATAAGKGKSPISSSLRSKQTQYGKAIPAQGTSTPGSPVSATGVGATSESPASVPYRGGPTTGVVKLAEQRFMEMSPADQILFVACLDKQANQQTLTYDPATKTFTRQHLTPSSGSPAVQGTGAAPIQAGHTEMVRNSGSAMAPYGSKAYFQSRLQQAGLGASRPPVPSPGAMSGGMAAGAMKPKNIAGLLARR